MAVLTTARLTLSEIASDDIQFVTDLLCDPVAMEYWPRPYSRAEALDWIARMQSRYVTDGCGYWIAQLTATHEPIGIIGVLNQTVGDETLFGIGYILSPSSCGIGLATEGALGCIDWMRIRNMTPIHALIRPTNLPSRRVAERLKMCETRRVTFADLEHIDYVLD